MKIAAAQMDIAWHDRSLNHARARQYATEAEAAGADLLVFPEMFSTGFSMDTSITAESLEGPTPRLFRDMALEHGLTVVGGFVLEIKDNRPKNVSLAVDRHGRDVALYAKIHLFTPLGENVYYDPGERPVPFDIQGFRAACLVCYDLRFPELFRTIADHCELIIIIASWPAVRQTHWNLLLRARAVENQCFVAGVNRTGEGGGHLFSGGSAIIDPAGETVAEGGNKERLLIADIDQDRVGEVRTAMPFLKDRKPHLFGI